MDRELIKNYCIQVAKAIIIDEGFQNISIRKVAIRSGFSNNKVSSIFVNKDNLRNHVSEDIFKELQTILSFNEPSLLETENLKEILKKYVEFYTQRPNLFKLFYQTDENHKIKDYEINKEYMREVLINRITKLIDYKHFGKEKNDILANILADSVHGIVLTCISRNEENLKYKIEEDISSIVEFIYR